MIARLEHQYTDKTSISHYSNDAVSKVDDYQMRRLKNDIDDLRGEVDRLNSYIEDENRKKRQLLTEIENAKERSVQERDALKRELADTRIMNKEYQRMAENSGLDIEVERLNRQNG